MSDATQAPPEDWVVVAVLGHTRGLKGELYAESWGDESRYSALSSVWLRRQDGSWANDGRPLQVAEVWPYKAGLVFRFEGIESIEAAQPLARCEVAIPSQDRPPLPEGEFYLADLVGCEVFDHRSGHKLGRVSGWQEFGGPQLLEVLADGETQPFWIPFARSICVEIDPRSRRIVVDPPEGLLELNREPRQ